MYEYIADAATAEDLGKLLPETEWPGIGIDKLMPLAFCKYERIKNYTGNDFNHSIVMSIMLLI